MHVEMVLTFANEERGSYSGLRGKQKNLTLGPFRDSQLAVLSALFSHRALYEV